MIDEDWTWEAIYDDASLCEYEPDGISHGFSEVDTARLRQLILIPQKCENTHVLHITEGLTPVFFRRRSINLSSDNRGTTTCMGWTRQVGGELVESYTFFFSDGSVLLTDDRNAL